MARFSRTEVLNRILDEELVPVFYHGDAETTGRVIAACAAAEVTVFEFTNRGDHAIDVFRSIVQHCARQLPQVILGAGSIADEATAALFVAHGANFIVGPSFNARVARFCNRRKIAYLPGCVTPTEIATAEESGVEIVKVFPCEAAGGPGFLKAVLGPMPWTRVMATGIADASKEGIAAWIEAGTCAFGLGRELIRKEYLDAKDYDAITRRATELRGWINEARSALAK